MSNKKKTQEKSTPRHYTIIQYNFRDNDGEPAYDDHTGEIMRPCVNTSDTCEFAGADYEYWHGVDGKNHFEEDGYSDVRIDVECKLDDAGKETGIMDVVSISRPVTEPTEHTFDICFTVKTFKDSKYIGAEELRDALADRLSLMGSENEMVEACGLVESV